MPLRAVRLEAILASSSDVIGTQVEMIELIDRDREIDIMATLISFRPSTLFGNLHVLKWYTYLSKGQSPLPLLHSAPC